MRKLVYKIRLTEKPYEPKDVVTIDLNSSYVNLSAIRKFMDNVHAGMNLSCKTELLAEMHEKDNWQVMKTLLPDCIEESSCTKKQ